MKYPPDAAASDIETTTGFFLLSRFICRQISSDAVTSPPGESMRTTTPFTSESFSTPRRSLLKPYDVRLPSPAPSSPGLPRTMSPSPTITAMWLLPASPTDSAVIREYLSMETREGSALIRSFSSPHIWSSKRKASTNPAWSACGAVNGPWSMMARTSSGDFPRPVQIVIVVIGAIPWEFRPFLFGNLCTESENLVYDGAGANPASHFGHCNLAGRIHLACCVLRLANHFDLTPVPIIAGSPA